jgi:hypothetical protein
MFHLMGHNIGLNSLEDRVKHLILNWYVNMSRAPLPAPGFVPRGSGPTAFCQRSDPRSSARRKVSWQRRGPDTSDQHSG